MRNKCPSCGYLFTKKYNASREVTMLLALRGKKCKKLLQKASNSIMSSINTDNSIYKYFMFLQAVSNIGDEYVTKCIERYLYKGYYIKGKGFFYLREMIKNEKSNRDGLLNIEYKNVGRPPSITKIREKENE